VLTPDEIEAAHLPRAAMGGYDRGITDAFLRRIARDVETILQERSLLEEEVRRLRRELVNEQPQLLPSSALAAAEEMIRELQEAAQRECALVLEKAREHAETIRVAAERDATERLDALRRVEEVHALVRSEVRALLAALLEQIDTPSTAIRAALKQPQLLEDLHRATRGAIADADADADADGK